MIFRKKIIDYASLSPSAKTWQRFRKNKPGITGLSIILLASIISILGYLITPDHTSFANEQKPELHILKPGTEIKQLQVRNNYPVERKSWLTTMISGKQNEYSSIPLNSWRFEDSYIVIEAFTEHAGEKETESRISLADVVYAIDPQKSVVYDTTKHSLIFFENGANSPTEKSIDALQAEIKEKHLISKKFLLGTDLLGRDLLSRLMIGTRISLSVGLISVFISIFIGIILGAIAGFYRGTIDVIISWFLNVVWSIPTILLVIAITLVLGKGITQVFIAVGLTMWVDVARVVRGQVLSIREKEFVEAGRALGFSNSRIIFKHVLPNVMGPVIVMAASNFASAILMEAGLSFLGLGAQPPIPSWGEMINAHRGYILMDKAYLAFIPGTAIMLLVLSFMMVGNALRDAMDTKLSDSQPLA